MEELKFFCGNASRDLAGEVCSYLKVPLGEAEVGRFSDGEISVKISENVRGTDVFILQSTYASADNLMELLIMIDALKRASAKQVTAVIPEGAFSGYVTMTTPSGTGFFEKPYHVIQPAPVLESVSPLKAGQGSTLTRTGNYLMGATSVLLNGKPIPTFKTVSNTQIQALVPKTQALGETQVTVTTPDEFMFSARRAVATRDRKIPEFAAARQAGRG